MEFEVYCDENHPELFTSQKPTANYLMIGSLWLPAELRDEIKARIWSLRKEHKVWGEIKGNFITCYVADRNIDQIEKSPIWDFTKCLKKLGN